MYVYAAPTAVNGAPLVVVLHHCFQNAVDAFVDAGWKRAADAYGLVVVLPDSVGGGEWFNCFEFAGLHRRGDGEPNSIRLMIDRAIRDYDADPRRVFITGFSAGAGMAVVMLGLYPELFAAGGVYAGVAYGCQHVSLGMRGCVPSTDPASPNAGGEALAALVPRSGGPWPPLALWAGGRDWVIDPVNSTFLSRQWAGLTGADTATGERRAIGLVDRTTYRDRAGRPAIEMNVIETIGHSIPVDIARDCGSARVEQMFSLVFDIGVCGTTELLRFWGLSPAPAPAR